VEFIIKLILLHEICCTSCSVRLQWGHDSLSFTTDIHINLELFFSCLTTSILVLRGRPTFTSFLFSWWSLDSSRSIAHVCLSIAISSDSFSFAFIWMERVFIRFSLHIDLFLSHVDLRIFSFSYRISMQKLPFILKHAFLFSVSCSHVTIFCSTYIWLEGHCVLKFQFILSLSSSLPIHILIILHNKSLFNSERWKTHSLLHLNTFSLFIHLLWFSKNLGFILVLLTVVLFLVSSHHVSISFVISKLVLAIGIQISISLSCEFDFFRCEHESKFTFLSNSILVKRFLFPFNINNILMVEILNST